MRRVSTSREALDEQVMMLTRVRIKTAACDLGRRWRNELSNVGKEWLEAACQPKRASLRTRRCYEMVIGTLGAATVRDLVMSRRTFRLFTDA